MVNQSDPAFLGWLAEFNTHIFRNSLFFKGPLLYFEPTTANEKFTPPAH